jgi:hypothetical protein
MSSPLTDPFATLIFCLAFPVGLCMQILTERLMLHPYPRHAWGSWFIVGWAAAAVLLVLQFVIGIHFYSRVFGQSFLGGGLLTTMYAFLMVGAINRVLPKRVRDAPPGFLLTNFLEHRRYIYLCFFLLAAISFILGFTFFLDPITSPLQLFRIYWMTVFGIGIFVPAERLAIHKLIYASAFPLLVIFVICFRFWGRI